MNLQDKYKAIKDMYLQGSNNPNTTIVMTWIPLTPSAVPTALQDSIFDAYGEPHHRDIQTLNSSFCDLPSLPPDPCSYAL